MAESVRQFREADTELSDDRLIARTLAGDADAFNILVKRWERPIYALTLRMLGRDEDARDACQEAFMQAYRNLSKFRGDAKFSSWMYRIALNACHSRLRGNHQNLVSLDAENQDGQKTDLPDPRIEDWSEQMQADERAQFVRRALQALPPELRQVIIMKEYQEMTFAEISAVLGVPVSTIKSRVYTGLQQLRLRLQPIRPTQ